MVNRVSLGEKICEVVYARAPSGGEMAHFDAILDPVVLEGNGFGSFYLTCFVGKFSADEVVKDDSGWALRMTEVCEGLADRFGFDSIKVHCGVFGFGYSTDNCGDNLAKDGDGAVNC